MRRRGAPSTRARDSPRARTDGAGMQQTQTLQSRLIGILKHPLFMAGAAAAVALGLFAFVTEAPAYAGTASETCANCHVMDSMYENYYRAAHHQWAECADCHLP